MGPNLPVLEQESKGRSDLRTTIQGRYVSFTVTTKPILNRCISKKLKITTKQFTELLGISALVVSLVFVAWELRQSNRIAIATAEAELRAGSREFNSLVAENPELAAILVKAREPNAILTPIEDEILRNYARTGFGLLTQMNAGYENGYLTSYTLEIFKTFITRNLDNNPSWVKYFEENTRDFKLNSYDSELWIHLVDELENRGAKF